MNPTQLGVTITGEVATITLTVPALWLLTVLVMAGIFLTVTQLRDWLSGVLARVWNEDRTTRTGGATSWE
jgi:phosphatidylglycerophosphate synthase